jgi:DNA repair protein RadC
LSGFTFKAYEVDIRRESVVPSPALNDTAELVDGIQDYYTGLDREAVLVCILDDVNRLIGVYEAALGGVSEVQVEFANIFRPAILLGGQKVIVVHNHPTGDAKPSEGDIRMAKGAFLIASLLDIELSDNIVLGAESWQSIHEEPEFVRWLSEDLVKIAAVMSGGVMTQAQLDAAALLKEELHEA